MKCPLKFSRYEFEGGTDCIGAECGFFLSVCGSVDAHSKTEQLLTEQSESSSDESDSRKKLEEEIRYEYNGSIENEAEQILGWLDRQAAIVEREWQESNDRLIDTMRTTSEQYREKIAELTAELEARDKYPDGFVSHSEMMERVGELTAQLHASNAERERLRECLGIATDNAHDFLTLVDESGNVYDRDEGLA